MQSPGTWTRHAAELASPDRGAREEAARKIWEQYATRLDSLVRRRLSRAVTCREGADDVVLAAFASFCLYRQRAPSCIASRDDLWKQMVKITLAKVANTANHHTAACRDVRREEVGLGVAGEDGRSFPKWMVEAMECSEPGPEVLAVLEEELEALLGRLTADQRRVVDLRMEGYTNEEIAQTVGRSVSTVEHKFKIARRALSDRLEELTAGHRRRTGGASGPR